MLLSFTMTCVSRLALLSTGGESRSSNGQKLEFLVVQYPNSSFRGTLHCVSAHCRNWKRKHSFFTLSQPEDAAQDHWTNDTEKKGWWGWIWEIQEQWRWHSGQTGPVASLWSSLGSDPFSRFPLVLWAPSPPYATLSLPVYPFLCLSLQPRAGTATSLSPKWLLPLREVLMGTTFSS